MRSGFLLISAAVSCIATSLGGAAVAAQQQSLRRGGTILPDAAEAVRAVPLAPHVDGILDDEAWRAAPVFSGFTQQDPNEGEAASEQTEFRVLYTDHALYVGIRALDSQPGEISALLTRRDEWSPSDEVGVMIDSYRDRRTAFVFLVNPAGVKRDSYLYDDVNEDDRWDAVWNVETSIDSEGWTAEFEIPFSQLRFSSDANTFGFNITRRLSRLNEVQYWRLIPKNASGRVSHFGDLTGIQGIDPPQRLEVLPYTVARTEMRPAVEGNPFRTGSDRMATVGADVKYGIGSALTLTATINPDFGQVEADPAVVNLSAFETFFPERRPFFNEGLDIFRFRIADGDGEGSQEELFYTRRIGRSPQGSADDRGGYLEYVDHTTILGAAKLSGKTQNGWTMGLTGALTDEEGASGIDANGASFREVVEPRTGYLVGRLARDFRGGLTQVGLFTTTVQRALPSELDFLHTKAYTGGFDWSHRFANNTYQFSGRIVGSHVQGSADAITRTQESSARYYQRPDNDYVTLDPTRTSLSGFATGMNVGRTAGDWRWNVGFDTRSPGLEVNDIGFQRQADFTSQWVWINRRWLQPGKVFRRFNVNFNQWSSWTYGWDRRNVGGNINANFMLRNYWNGWFGMNRNFGGLSTTELRGGPSISTPGGWNGWFGFGTDTRKSVRASTFTFFFLQDDTESWGAGTSFNLSWRPASNIDLTASPSVNWNRDEWQFVDSPEIKASPEYLFGYLRQTTTSMTFRSNVTFTPTLSLQIYAQPFVSVGDYVGFSRVVAPRVSSFRDQFETFGDDRVQSNEDGVISLDFDGDGTFDYDLDNPDFTYLSFRSNLVLRWEYTLGSTVFLVWQHGRTDSSNDGNFELGPKINQLFAAPAENVFLVKINYWLGR